jgi:hypothetical protein
MFMMKKFKKVVSLALASIMTLSMCAVSALSAGAVDAEDYTTLPITKILQVNSKDTVVPSENFAFTMTPIAAADLIDDNGDAIKDGSGHTLEVGPALSDNDIVISFNKDSKAADSNGKWEMTNSGSFKLEFATNFTNTGVFRYEVKETGAVDQDGKSLSETYVDFDSSTYYVDVYVGQNNKGEYVINSYVITKKGKTGKPNGITFTNKYNCQDLNIYKTVDGTEFNQGEYYNFHILIPVGGKAITLSENSYFLAKIIGTDGSVVKDGTDRDMDIDSDGYLKLYVKGEGIDVAASEGNAFKLKAGEHLQILDLPTTMIYKVEEDKDTADAEGYTITYDYTEIGSKETTTKAVKEDQSGYSVQGTINDTTNTVTFINTRDMTPPTGISLDVLPYALIVLVAACGGVLLIIKKKRNAQ